MPLDEAEFYPKVQVITDIKEVENIQKSVDEGHSPWRLDPAYVSQVFASTLIEPEGAEGEYPIPYDSIKMLAASDSKAIAEVCVNDTAVKRIYLEKQIRQDSTGAWTVVGYDPVK